MVEVLTDAELELQEKVNSWALWMFAKLKMYLQQDIRLIKF